MSYISNIYIDNFLSFNDMNIEFDYNENIITGKNGIGKSLLINLIESLINNTNEFDKLIQNDSIIRLKLKLADEDYDKLLNTVFFTILMSKELQKNNDYNDSFNDLVSMIEKIRKDSKKFLIIQRKYHKFSGLKTSYYIDDDPLEYLIKSDMRNNEKPFIDLTGYKVKIKRAVLEKVIEMCNLENCLFEDINKVINKVNIIGYDDIYEILKNKIISLFKFVHTTCDFNPIKCISNVNNFIKNNNDINVDKYCINNTVDGFQSLIYKNKYNLLNMMMNDPLKYNEVNKLYYNIFNVKLHIIQRELDKIPVIDYMNENNGRLYPCSSGQIIIVNFIAEYINADNKIIIVDELFSDFGNEIKDRFYKILKKFSKGRQVILITNCIKYICLPDSNIIKLIKNNNDNIITINCDILSTKIKRSKFEVRKLVKSNIHLLYSDGCVIVNNEYYKNIFDVLLKNIGLNNWYVITLKDYENDLKHIINNSNIPIKIFCETEFIINNSYNYKSKLNIDHIDVCNINKLGFDFDNETLFNMINDKDNSYIFDNKLFIPNINKRTYDNLFYGKNKDSNHDNKKILLTLRNYIKRKNNDMTDVIKFLTNNEYDDESIIDTIENNIKELLDIYYYTFYYKFNEIINNKASISNFKINNIKVQLMTSLFNDKSALDDTEGICEKIDDLSRKKYNMKILEEYKNNKDSLCERLAKIMTSSKLFDIDIEYDIINENKKHYFVKNNEINEI